MLLVRGVTGNPDTVIRDHDSAFDSLGALTPLEVEDVVGNEVPGLADVFRVVELLEDAAWLVHELRARRPGGSQRPRALRGMEQELLHALSRVEGLDVAAAVLGNPVDSVGA